MQYEHLIILVISVFLHSINSINAKKITLTQQDILYSNRLDGQSRNIIDGDLNTFLVVVSQTGNEKWITLKLDNFYIIDRIIVKRRQGCCENHMYKFSLYVGDSFCENDPSSFPPTQDSLCYSYDSGINTISLNLTCSQSILGKYITIFKNDINLNIHLAEIEIYGELLSDVNQLQQTYVYKTNKRRGFVLNKEKVTYSEAKERCHDKNSYLVIHSEHFLTSYLKKETIENKFWREGRYINNQWYLTSDCSIQTGAVPSSVNPASNDMKLYLNADLQMYADDSNKRFYYICERDLPNSVSDCPDYCGYCEISSNIPTKCICENGRWGGNCQWPCSGNFYGIDCTLKCGNCKGGEKCDSETGKCISVCENGWTGDKCNESLTTESVTTRKTTRKISTTATEKRTTKEVTSSITIETTHNSSAVAKGGNTNKNNQVTLIVGVVIAIVLVLLIACVVGIFVVRMRKNKKAHPENDLEESTSVKDDYLETASNHVPSVNNDLINSNKKSVINEAESVAYENMLQDTKVEDLGRVIDKLSKDDQKGFEKEFLELPNGQIHEWSVALREDVKSTKKKKVPTATLR